MSAPSRVRLRPLPEYEPARSPIPPDPDELDFDDPTTRWRTLGAATGQRLRLAQPIGPPPDCPVWDERGEIRDRLGRLLCIVLEVLDGRRKVNQLRDAVDPHSYEALLTRSRVSSGACRQHRLHSLHTCRPARGIIELCATIAVSSPTPHRPKAMTIAARVELHNDTWRCTTLRIL